MARQCFLLAILLMNEYVSTDPVFHIFSLPSNQLAGGVERQMGGLRKIGAFTKQRLQLISSQGRPSNAKKATA